MKLEDIQKLAIEYLDANFRPTRAERNALMFLAMGRLPQYSSDVAECLTAGYGSLDGYGNFEFPLPAWITNEIEKTYDHSS